MIWRYFKRKNNKEYKQKRHEYSYHFWFSTRCLEVIDFLIEQVCRWVDWTRVNCCDHCREIFQSWISWNWTNAYESTHFTVYEFVFFSLFSRKRSWRTLFFKQRILFFSRSFQTIKMCLSRSDIIHYYAQQSHISKKKEWTSYHWIENFRSNFKH